jgi:lactate permease
MPWAVAYVQDLNPATSLTILATLITTVICLTLLVLLNRRILPATPALMGVVVTPFVVWVSTVIVGTETGLPVFSGTIQRITSTVIAAVPVLVLFYLLVGRRWLASAAGAAGAVAAVLLAGLLYQMPFEMASWAFVHGAVFGLLPIGWTVFAAMLLYNLTVETGQFTIIRRSIAGLSGDARVQAVLIGFCFGAFLEGAAGAGSPVAICGAMLVGLGVPPIRAAVICLLANTSPVCYGGLGVPIITLANVTGLDVDQISVMCGHQLPFLSCLIPLYMVKIMCTWRQTFEMWPVLLVGGGSFAVFQYTFATMHSWGPGFPVLWPMTDIGGGIFSLISLAVFLRFWKPKKEFRFSSDIATGPKDPTVATDPHAIEAKEAVDALLEPKNGKPEKPLTVGSVALAWSPWVIMSVLLMVSGIIRQRENDPKRDKRPVDLGFAKSFYEVPVPTLDRQVERADRLQKPGAQGKDRTEAASFRFAWLTAPGTSVFVAVLISALVLRVNWSAAWAVLRRTLIQMKVPIPTIACMLGLSYVTKYAGMDATLGVAFAETGVMYPFFAAMLGWLGVFLTGTDAGSNALFGSLQRITATEVYAAHGTGAMSNLTELQAQTLICTSNSTGGVMGKMIDAQSICVATAGTNQIGKEADIFKAVIWHSILLAAIVGLMTAVQAYVFPFTKMVPG